MAARHTRHPHPPTTSGTGTSGTGSRAPSHSTPQTSSSALPRPETHRRGHAVWIAPIVALIMLLGIVMGAALLNSVTRRRIEFDDGTAWIVSQADRGIARFNVRSRQIEATLPATQPQFTVLQSGDRAALLDGSRIAGIDAATLITTDGMSPVDGTGGSNDIDVAVGGGTVAFLLVHTGEVWAGELDDVDRFGPGDEPVMQLGEGGLVAVDHTGALYGYRPRDGMVLRMDRPVGELRELGSLSHHSPQSADSFTVVGGTPIIASGTELVWRAGRIAIDAQPPFLLQQPPADTRQTGWVALTAPSAIVAANLTHATSAQLAIPAADEAVVHGSAVQPVSSDGCVHMAWARPDKNYIRLCGADTVDELDRADVDPRLTLAQVTDSSSLTFQVNHRQVVLNDTSDGTVWIPNVSLDAIVPQWNLAQPQSDGDDDGITRATSIDPTFDDSCTPESGQITAVDDEFAARLATSRILDVLGNDRQTDCAVLRITHVDALSETTATVLPIHNGRYLQLDAATEAASPPLRFRYTISDGRGQTSSATITVHLRDHTGNNAPEQTGDPPEYAIEQGALRTLNALGAFNDPDGDDLTLISASARDTSGRANGESGSGNGLAVSARADGQLTVSAGPAISGRNAVTVTVSDGRTTATGVIYVVAHQPGTLPAALDPVVVRAAPNTAVTVDLTPYVHRTSAQPARLSAVEAPPGASATVQAGTLSFTAAAATLGSTYMPFTIAQGAIDAIGLVRIDTDMPDGQHHTPLLANDVAILDASGTAVIEPLRNDVDPLGGVLAITGTDDLSQDSGLECSIVSHHRIAVTTRRALSAPIRLIYHAANAEASSSAAIVVQPYIAPETPAPLQADDFSATVRTGGVLTLNALDHVSSAPMTDVHLSQDIDVDAANFDGLIFASDETIRYQAPQTAGTFTATYTVSDDYGATDSGTVTITVRQSDERTKAAPAPRDVTAQVAAGATVRIPITLTGIDPDGDDVILSGLGNTTAQLGRVTDIDASGLVYEAYPDSQGTDTFTYAVEDWTGQRAQATIRVGVLRTQVASAVHARDDAITLRPGTRASVPVTGNDISQDGTPLRLMDHVEAQGVDDVQVHGDSLTLLTPDTPATIHAVYQVSNAAGVTDTATLTVHVDPEAAIDPPSAADYHVPPAATIDKRTIEVDIAPWISNPSGTNDELRVTVHESAGDHARMVDGKPTTIALELTDRTRMVPYQVTNTVHNLTSTAFIQVPAYGVFPPMPRPKAPALIVSSGASITIAVADYVRVGAGKTASIESPESVSATKSDGDNPYIDAHTLRFTAAKGYAGPASITFTATDSERNARHGPASPTADDGRGEIVSTAVISLDITVLGKDVPPPTLSQASIDVAAGEPATTVALASLTHMPDRASPNAYTITYASPGTHGDVTSHVTADGTMTIEAAMDAKPGTAVAIPVALHYEHDPDTRGTVATEITARVTRSSKPLARLSATPITLRAGAPTTVDIFEGAYNPFPDTPLTIKELGLADDSRIRVTHTNEGIVTLTPDTGAGALATTMTVTVEDGTHTVDRHVRAIIAIFVTDRPSPPALSTAAVSTQDGAVTLRWTPGQANGSPISEYRVDYSTEGHRGSLSCGSNTICTVSGLANAMPYSFTVRARNANGWSEDSNVVIGTADRTPSAPANVHIAGGYLNASVTWERPDYQGSAPTHYTVVLLGNGIEVATKTSHSLSERFDVPASAITDGGQFTAIVTAYNQMGAGPGGEASEPALVWSDPSAPVITVTQRPGTAIVDAAVTLTDTRNAGCVQIALSEAFEASLPCDAASATFGIGDNKAGSELTLTATVLPRQPGAKPATASVSFIAHAVIAPPESETLEGVADQVTPFTHPTTNLVRTGSR